MEMNAKPTISHFLNFWHTSSNKSFSTLYKIQEIDSTIHISPMMTQSKGQSFTQEHCHQIVKPESKPILAEHINSAPHHFGEKADAMNWKFAFLQIHVINPNCQCDGIRRWDLWEEIRSWGRSPHEWDSCHLKEEIGALPHHHMRTQQESGCLQLPESPHQTDHSETLISHFQPPNCEKAISLLLSYTIHSILLQQPQLRQLLFHRLGDWL
jgi:hypothetical protein